jgi:hypothetical protein
MTWLRQVGVMAANAAVQAAIDAIGIDARPDGSYRRQLIVGLTAGFPHSRE